MKYSMKAAYIFATGLGTGYFPIAPGTAGSLLAALIFWFLPVGNLFILIASILFFIPGVIASSVVEKAEEKDPGKIVIDEIVGQWLTYLLLPKTLTFLILGFFVFRILDVIKPYPANISQNLNGGLGVMLDDVIAAIYANLILQVLNLWII